MQFHEKLHSLQDSRILVGTYKGIWIKPTRITVKEGLITCSERWTRYFISIIRTTAPVGFLGRIAYKKGGEKRVRTPTDEVYLGGFPFGGGTGAGTAGLIVIVTSIGRIISLSS